MDNAQSLGLPDGWISQEEQSAFQNEFTIPASIQNTLLPSPIISLKALASFALPVMVEKSTNRKYGTDYFTANPSISITPPVLMRLQHLPMPEQSTIKELVEIGHQAWLNGAKSVRYAHLSNDSNTTDFPLWTITFWNRVLDAKEVSSKWIDSVDWVMAQLHQKKSEERQMLAEQAMLYIAALPWAVNKPSGLSDSEPIHSLWRYLGPNWLSGSNQNDLLGLLRYQLAGQSNMTKIYRVEGTDTPQKILSVYRNRHKICYTEERSVEWLRTLANDLIKNEATLITMQNLTNITGSHHWVPLALSVDKHSLLFGDSLGNEIPKELRMAYTWWMAQHDVSRNFESDILMAVSSMSIGQQIDGHACGILAINALHHLIEPNRTLLNSGSIGDVVKERLALFNMVASNIIRRVSKQVKY